MLITALCVLGCSAIAFAWGYRFRAVIIRGRLELFFVRYYDRISAPQPDETRVSYCKGAVDMFHGLIAELGMKVVQTKSPDASNTGQWPATVDVRQVGTPAVVCRLHTLNRRRG